MREIEFRQPMFGENGEFIGFHYWGFIDGKFIGPSSAWTNGQESQQYTGLKDKNGKKIFEGDAVIVYEYLEGKPWNLHDAVVEYGYGGFIINPAYCYQSIRNTLEVIGNIYENPELLEQSK